MNYNRLSYYSIKCKKCGYTAIVNTEYERKLREASNSSPEQSLTDVFRNIGHRLICSNCHSKGSAKLVEPIEIKVGIAPNQSHISTGNGRKPKQSNQSDKKITTDIPKSQRQALQGERYCIDCGGLIPAARLKAIPDATRCTHCQSVIETAVPNLSARMLDEGLVGSREGHKKMRAQQWKGRRRR